MGSEDRSPAFPFYAKVWLSDAKVRSLSNANRGKYIDLLCTMWEYSEAGCYLPRSMAEKIWGKAFIRSIADEQNSPLTCEDMDGQEHIFSGRLLEESQKHRSRREAAKRAADTRWAKQKGCERNANA